jgi:hypothetical protein
MRKVGFGQPFSLVFLYPLVQSKQKYAGAFTPAYQHQFYIIKLYFFSKKSFTPSTATMSSTKV